MNILLVHNFYQQPGGEDQVFADECTLLEDRGHTVGRFTMDNDAIEGMGRLTLARKTIWNRDAQQSLRDAICRIDADVVHFHNTFPLVSPACYYAAHEEGAAVVQTLHNYRLLCPSATFFRDGAVCESCLGRTVAWPGVLHKCYRGNRVATAAVASMLSYHRMKHTWRDEVDRYICLTEFSREKFIQGGLPAEKLFVKPNFVDPDPGIGDGSGGFMVFVGRLTEEKGILTLLEAWKTVYAAANVELKILGDGPLRPQVERAAREIPGIRFEGRLPLGDVYDAMGSAKALIFPSQWYEGLPRTIIESLSRGTPVIASRLGSMPELVEHGQTGRLFEAGDPADLARQTIDLISAPNDRIDATRRAARNAFEARFTADQNYPLLIECYEQAINGSMTGNDRAV